MKPLRFVALLLIALPLAACNLGTAQDAREQQMIATQTALPPAQTMAATLNSVTPTALDLQLTPLGSPASGGAGGCDRLIIDVGDDPGNRLRLRSAPTNNSTILLLIPNSTVVQRVAGSNESAADGYTWVNIIYTDPNGDQVTGWAAKNAMRDRVTLRPAGC